MIYGDRVQMTTFGFDGSVEGLSRISSVQRAGTVASVWPDAILVEFDDSPGVPQWVQPGRLQKI